MDEAEREKRRQDPAESGALEPEREGEVEGDPRHEESTESGALEEEQHGKGYGARPE